MSITTTVQTSTSAQTNGGVISLKTTTHATPQAEIATRDPHHFPSFSPNTVPTQPILYLPPLLSSLPDRFPAVSIDSQYPPIVTDTRLPDIDPASLSLHKALHDFKPLNDKYAALPYEEAFNWDELTLSKDDERSWYCVVFRSRRKPGSESGPLYEADRKAHDEAVRNGGLILYWYGIPSPETGMNLATCIWQSRKHAMAANSRPHHAEAMRLAAASYEVYDLERYTLRKTKGETGVTVEPYRGGDIGW